MDIEPARNEQTPGVCCQPEHAAVEFARLLSTMLARLGFPLQAQ